MAKAGLPESQSPEGASKRPPEKMPVTGAGPCGEMIGRSPQSSGAQERCPVGAFKETDGTPKSRSTRTAVMNMGSPKGRESYGDGVPVVVGGVTSAQSGDR
jgi:hypothetical protein